MGWEIVTNSQTDSADKTVSVSCAGIGNKVLGGGYQVSAGGNESKVSVVQNYPSAQTTWTVQAVENVGIAGSWTLSAYAVCGTAV